MSDGNAIKSGIGQFAADVGEAIIEPATDAIGEALEEGAQAIIPGPQQMPSDPQAAQQFQQAQVKKEENNQEKRQWAEATIARYQKIDKEQAQVRMKQKQEEQTKQQVVQQEEQKKGLELQTKEQKSADLTAIQQAARRTEIKGGLGG